MLLILLTFIKILPQLPFQYERLYNGDCIIIHNRLPALVHSIHIDFDPRNDLTSVYNCCFKQINAVDIILWSMDASRCILAVSYRYLEKCIRCKQAGRSALEKTTQSAHHLDNLWPKEDRSLSLHPWTDSIIPRIFPMWFYLFIKYSHSV